VRKKEIDSKADVGIKCLNFMRKFTVILIAVFLVLSLSACSTSLRSVRQYAEKNGMVVVPAGWFRMGLNSAEINERPEQDVYLDTYLIDKYEVSAAQFAGFLNDKGNPDDRYFSDDRHSTVIGVSYVNGNKVENSKNPSKYVPRRGLENYPANNVSWYGAYAYCRWKGKRLPSEAEWEKAARCDDGRTYPWGDSMPDDKKAMYNQKWRKKGFNVMVPVDALPEGKSCYGALNMAGNVWEWVNDWYRQNYCNFCYGTIEDDVNLAAKLLGVPKSTISYSKEKNAEIPPRENPGGPLLGTFKVMRGGSWYDSYGDLAIRTTYRYWFHPADRYPNFGFRCAKDAPGKKDRAKSGNSGAK
jgi:formylglycine-generating enzyme required for sulfatase activity